MASGKYKLLADHLFPGDMYLVSGTIVGDGTQYPFEGRPSFNMEPLDDAARAAVEETGPKSKPEMPASINALGMNPAIVPRPGPGLGKVGTGPKDAVAAAKEAAGIPAEERARVEAAEKSAAAFAVADKAGATQATTTTPAP